MQLFFNISALFPLQRIFNILQKYWKLDIFIKPSGMTKLVTLPGNSEYHVWKTKFAVLNIDLFTYFYFQLSDLASALDCSQLTISLFWINPISFILFYLQLTIGWFMYMRKGLFQKFFVFLNCSLKQPDGIQLIMYHVKCKSKIVSPSNCVSSDQTTLFLNKLATDGATCSCKKMEFKPKYLKSCFDLRNQNCFDIIFQYQSIIFPSVIVEYFASNI